MLLSSMTRRESSSTPESGDPQRGLGAAIFEWIEAWYNPQRRHTSLEMLAPHEFETLHTAANPAA